MSSQRITVDHRVMGGAPCIRGTRIPVVTVIRELAEGTPAEQLLVDFPQLTPEDISEALRYAARAVEHREIPLLPDW